MSYAGMNASTGRAIADTAHIRQSIADILMTPLGSRVMRRDYGSLLPELIDQPLNGATRMKAMGACVMALIKWEPRIRPTHIALTLGDDQGALTIELTASLATGPRAGQSVSLSVPLKGLS